MKYLISLIVISLTCGCASNTTTISYSPFFKVKIPLNDLEGSVFFQSDSISVKFDDGGVLSGLIIDKALESLPETFTLSEYPEYSLGLKSPSHLAEPYASLFQNSWEETKRTYKNPQITKTENDAKAIYTACSVNSCLSFLVDKNMPEHILMLTAAGVTENKFRDILKGF